MVLSVVIMGVAGEVCVLKETHLEWHGEDLKSIISQKTSTCICRIDLFAGAASQFRVRKDQTVERILHWMRPHDHKHVVEKLLVEDHQSFLFMKIKSIEDREIPDLVEDGICIKCMYTCGVPLIDLFRQWITTGGDAKSLFAAGVPLSELLEARNQRSVQYQLCGHPPCRQYTLFHSQLQTAGYTARNFRDAGFAAVQLSYKASDFYREVDLTVGDLEWEETHAFFAPSELKEAGFEVKDLIDACFDLRDLKEAGFKVKDLVEAGFTATTPLLHAGFELKDLIKAGFTESELPQAKSMPQKRQRMTPKWIAPAEGAHTVIAASSNARSSFEDELE